MQESILVTNMMTSQYNKTLDDESVTVFRIGFTQMLILYFLFGYLKFIAALVFIILTSVVKHAYSFAKNLVV